jgi:glutamate-1-semialdehyde 2,1-aminomutase
MARMAKRVARLVPGYSYDEARFFAADDAPADIQALRKAGFTRLSAALQAMAPRTLALTAQTREGVSDMQFTGRYRVPFQFSEHARQHLPVGAFWGSAQGVELTDLDGNRFLDLTGSYGVNVFGHAFYQRTLAEGARRAQSRPRHGELPHRLAHPRAGGAREGDGLLPLRAHGR